MKSNYIIAILLIISAVISLSFLANSEDDYEYSQTKAICSGNSCQDFLITCNNNEVVDMKPLTGLIVFSDSWEDPRNEEEKRLC